MLRLVASSSSVRASVLLPLSSANHARFCSAASTGVSVDIADVSRTNLVKAMMSQIDQPQRFFPAVKSCTVRPALGDAGEDGALWRSLVRDGYAELVEHVYANPAMGEVRYVRLGADGAEGEVEVISKVHRGEPVRVEYYQRNRFTNQRVPLTASKSEVIEALGRAVDLARAAQAQAQDACDFGGKA